MGNNKYQIQYWKQLVELRVHISYLYYYAVKCEWWDRSFNIFLALTSSGSIAAWALWQQLNFVWPTLIAVSQVITAVKPFFPFNLRKKHITELKDDLQLICLDMERDWYNVSEGNLSEQDIYNLVIQYRGKVVEAEKSRFKDMILPRKSKLLVLAENDAKIYLKKYFDLENE